VSCRRPAPVISLARFRLGASSSVRQSPAKPAGSARRYAGRALHRSNSLISARACVSGARPRTRTGAWAGANAGPMRREDRSAGPAGRDPARPEGTRPGRPGPTPEHASTSGQYSLEEDSALSCRQELQGFELRTLLSPEAPRVRTPHSLVARSSKGSNSALSCRQELQGFGPRTLLSPGAPRVRTAHSLVARSSKGSNSALSCRQELQGFGLRTLLSPGAPRVRTPHSLVARSSKGSDSALRQLPRTAVATGPRTLLSPGAPRVRTPHSGNYRGRQ